MTALTLLFTLSAIGISETSYLIRKRRAEEKVACPLNGDSCAVVLESNYNKLFKIHNDILGLGFYVMAALLSGIWVIGIEPIETWALILKISVALSALLSVFLTYIQWRVLKTWCFWCLMSAFTVWGMGIILLVGKF